MTQAQAFIEKLNLEKHPEGGYFYRTFCSDIECINMDGNTRPAMSSIYYLLTKEAHLSYFAVNRSDLILYHHSGSPLKIIFLYPDGKTKEQMLGCDVLAGQTPQVTCPAGVYKAYDMMGGDFSLVSEAVCPGFVYEDMNLPTFAELQAQIKGNIGHLKKYTPTP